MTAPHDLTPAQRWDAFVRAVQQVDDYLTRKAAEKAAKTA